MIDSPPQYEPYFPAFFACLGIFYWMPNIMNFTFLVDGYFCLINILKTLLWDAVKVLENSSNFSDLLLWFVRQDWSSYQPRAKYFTILIKNHMHALPNALWMKFSRLADRSKHNPQSCVSARHCFFCFWMVLS